MIRASHADNDVYGENEVSSIQALIQLGADVNTPAVLPHVCDGTMPFTDFQYRLSSLKLLLAAGSAPVSALDGLVESYKDDDASQKQFMQMTDELFKAGATLSDLKADVTDEKLQSPKVLLARA